MLALGTIWRLTEIESNVVDYQERIPYRSDKRMITALPAEPPFVRRSASGADVREGEKHVIWSSYREEFPICRIFLKKCQGSVALLKADGTDVKPIHTLEEQDALTKSASPTASAAMGEVVVPLERSPSSSAMASAEKH